MNLSVDLLPIFSPLLFFISFFGMITSRNVIKAIICIIMMQMSVVLLWLSVGASHGTTPPMLSVEQLNTYGLEGIADPLPQALMLTAIVIGISVTAIIIIMLNAIFREHYSTDWGTLERLAAPKEDLSLKEESSC